MLTRRNRQAFSRANTSPNPNDGRVKLIATFLSFVGFYQPDYAVMENVCGLIDFKKQPLSNSDASSDSEQDSDHEGLEKVVTCIEESKHSQPMVKFVLGKFVELGYV